LRGKSKNGDVFKISDNQRYQLTGNGVHVNVVIKILEKVLTTMEGDK